MKINFALLGKVGPVAIVLLTPFHNLRRSKKIARIRELISRNSSPQQDEHDESEAAAEVAEVEAASSQSTQSEPSSEPDLDRQLHSHDLRENESDDDHVSETSKVSKEIGSSATVSIPQSTPKADVNSRKLLYDFDMYRQQLEAAQQMLDDREDTFQQERQERDDMMMAGHAVKTLSEIDVDELQETGRLTRWVIEAEEEYNAAKTALVEAGIQPPGSDVESGFVDDVDDGYRLSFEEDMEHSVDPRRVQRWLEDIPKTTEPGPSEPEDAIEERDIDAWSAVSVEMCDSWSMVADGAQRRRIDKWKALAAAAMGK